MPKIFFLSLFIISSFCHSSFGQVSDSLQNAFYSQVLNNKFVFTDFSNLPQYYYSDQAYTNYFNFDVVLSDIEVEELSTMPEFLNTVESDFSIHTQSSSIAGSYTPGFYICPFRKNNSTGKIEVLKSFRHTFIYSEPITEIPNKKTYAQQSVLSNGTIYKLSTINRGIHKITYSDLIAMGVNPSGINPLNIHLYGNGSKMVPEGNSISYYDDLQEIAIQIIGENDGVFNTDDYILFYADAMTYWNYSNNRFQHTKNLYAEKNYFFLKTDNNPGLRISTLANETTANKLTSVFQDFSVHEVDQFNLIKSGKTWYGEKFDLTNSYAFTFSFPNIVLDSNYCVYTSAAAKSTFSSSFTISSGGSSSVISIPATSGYQNDYAMTGNSGLCRKASSSSIGVGISYNNGGNSSAMGWLDFIEVLAWRKLILNGSQMNFRNPSTVKTGNITEFILENAPGTTTIWDVTIPEKPSIISGNFSGNNYHFIQKTDSLREFIVFNWSGFFSATFEGIMTNQNLHASTSKDFIIVSYPDFVGYADKIGQLHEQRDGYSYLVATPQQIYNEFSGGKQDIGAIRNFVKMFYDRATTNDEKPKFLMLVGDASYDYLSRIADNTNYIPVFQSVNSLSPTASYASDDFFGLLDQSEGDNCTGNLDIGIGRLPVASVAEADAYYQKLLRYLSTNENSSTSMCTGTGCPVQPMSDWRNTIVFVADDGDGNLHYNQTERLTARVDTVNKFVNIDKVYVDAYTQITTSGGERAPEVNRAINDRVSKGALIINYVGHGGESGWGHERYLQNGDIFSWENKCNLPVFLTATCEFSRFDDPERRSSGEYVFHQANGGAIALLTTTRLAYSSYNEALNKSFFDKVFVKTDGEYPTLGQLMSYSKTANGSALNLRNFSLLGDPALRLSVPKNNIITDSINGVSVSSFDDTLKAYDKVRISGHIEDPDGNLIPDFNGILSPSVFDKPMQLATLGFGSGNYVSSFDLQQNIIYKGKVSIINGNFNFEFYIPRDIQYNFAKGKISYYAENGSTDATGYFEDFCIGGSNSAIGDGEGPEISLFMNDTLFSDGGITDQNPVFLAYVSDNYGINTVGNGIGHDITAIIDDNTLNTYVLNAYFSPDLNNSKKGVVRYPFNNLSEGKHTLRFKVWDIFNNSSEKELHFTVIASDQIQIENLYTYPNPLESYCYFVFDHNQACCGMDIEITISDISGRVVRQLEHTTLGESYRINPIYWDGRDSGGNILPAGVYPYRIKVSNAEGAVNVKTGKIVITPTKQ